MKRWVLGVVALVGVACNGQVVVNDAGPLPVVPLTTHAIDKMDLLFAIDNSPSMGDKQELLALAVPSLVGRLLNPNCVDTDASHACKDASDCSALAAGAECDVRGNAGGGQCFVRGDGGGGDNQCKSIPNTKAEFPPIHDLHVGIVSSSLGSGGLTSSADPCVFAGNDATHQDDHGHLLDRTWDGASEGTVANAKPLDGNGGNFLAWLPASDPKNQGKSDPNVTKYSDGQETPLESDFATLIQGVQEHGCGLEAQLESWYRFLIQPDPWRDLVATTDTPPRVKLDGIDATLLKMRHDFLRPDSVVAIIQLTDEDDSWSDPIWGGDVGSGGFGWVARTMNFPGGPGGGVGPRGTSACDVPVDPNDPEDTGPNGPPCTSCAFNGNANDPNCSSCAGNATGCKPGWYTPAQDGLNVRYGEQTMKPRYGLDPQFPIQRYVDGLTSPRVPDSANESHTWPTWAPTRNCTNPLFAEDLPDGSDTSSGALCDLKPGPRTPDLVFYAILGGVPNSLVDDANGALKRDLSASDWQAILGRDPDHFQLDGIDPHMIESQSARPSLEVNLGATYALGNDPDEGREWDTNTSVAGVDLQYACTFDLPAPRDCSTPENAGACDCTGTAATESNGPPLCDVANRTSQIRGKAYPTIRELRVAKGLGANAVVASLCAKVVSGSATDPSFGYNPAMQAIVDRLKSALSGQCLAQALPRRADGTVSCDLFAIYANQTNQAAGCTDPGMSQPRADDLKRFAENYVAAQGGNPLVPIPVLCVYRQLVAGADYSGASCERKPASGWCYVEGAANTGGCAQMLQFAGAGPPPGTTLDLSCLTP